MPTPAIRGEAIDHQGGKVLGDDRAAAVATGRNLLIVEQRARQHFASPADAGLRAVPAPGYAPRCFPGNDP